LIEHIAAQQHFHKQGGVSLAGIDVASPVPAIICEKSAAATIERLRTVGIRCSLSRETLIA
jgi:hypothetical protein